MIRWDRFDLELPDDFPVAAVDSLHAYLSDRDPTATQATEWREWAQALNGLAFRFRACDEDWAAALESIGRSDAPPQPERYYQERWLFGFFFQGYSAIECFYYGMYFIGALANPSGFARNIVRKHVAPRRVSDQYSASFPGDTLTVLLNAVFASTEFEEWGTIRNILGHRGAPGRAFFEGSDDVTQWNLPLTAGTLPLDPRQLERRRRWLGEKLNDLAVAADTFARQHVP